MAVLKHIASRNRCYSDSINYLTYQHNEFTNTPILDENGMMIEYCGHDKTTDFGHFGQIMIGLKKE